MLRTVTTSPKETSVPAHDPSSLAIHHSRLEGWPIRISQRKVGHLGIEVVAGVPVAVFQRVSVPICTEHVEVSRGRAAESTKHTLQGDDSLEVVLIHALLQPDRVELAKLAVEVG